LTKKKKEKREKKKKKKKKKKQRDAIARAPLTARIADVWNFVTITVPLNKLDAFNWLPVRVDFR